MLHVECTEVDGKGGKAMVIYAVSVFVATLLAWLYQSARGIREHTVTARVLKRASPVFLLASFAILFLVSGTRVDVGVDYPSYANAFTELYLYGFSPFEAGFQMLLDAIQLFTANPQWLFIVTAFITIGLIYVSIVKFSVNPALSVFLFTTMGFFSHSLNLTRQFIAVAIMLYAFSYVITKKPVRFVLAILVASLFHKTVFIMLPLYYLLRLKLKPMHYLLIGIVSGAVALFQDLIINTLVVSFYPQYYNETFIGDRIVSPYYIILGVALLSLTAYLLKKKAMSLSSISDRVYINLVFLVSIAHIFYVWLPLSNRVFLYLDIALILIIPKLLSYIERKYIRRAALAVMVIYFTYAAYISLATNANEVLPYKSTLLTNRVK